MKYLFSILLVATMISCSKDENTIVNIRLKNVSSLDFENATYNNMNYGTLMPGQASEYKQFESSYSYGTVSIIIGDSTYGWQPIDFVGEQLLETGNYTFEYDFDETDEILSDELIRD